MGATGEATVLELATGRFDYSDSIGEQLVGDQRLTATGVVLGGRWWHPS